MKIKWLGHSAFLLTASDGTRIITDPYLPDGEIAYGPVTDTADYVTVSHNHSDHNNVSGLPGKPEVIRSAGRHKAGGVAVAGFDSFHDAVQGARRGRNVIFVFEDAGLRVAHLGDLGHVPVSQAEGMGRVDVALVPVGGFYTIDAAEAHKTAALLDARVIVPMHYATAKTQMPIVGVEEFIKGQADVRHVGRSDVEVSLETLPDKPETWVMEHEL